MKKLVTLFLALALCLGLAVPAYAAEVTTIVPFGRYDRIGGETAAVFSEGRMMVCKDGKWGYIDTAGQEIIPCQYDEAHDFFDGLALVKKDGKFGYINTTGQLVIPCQYDWGRYFYDGLSEVRQDGEDFFIDKTGSKVFSCLEDCFYEDFSEGLVVTEKQDTVTGQSKYGYTDTTGRLVIPCQYENASPFCDGLAVVEQDGKFGYIDTTGQVVIPFRYDLAYTFTGDRAAVSNENGGGYIDRTGKEAIPCQYNLAESFGEDGLAAVSVWNREAQESRYGYIDTTGQMVVPCQYAMAWAFADGLARVANADQEYGFVDTTGREVIPCQYDLVYDFSDGMARLMAKDGKWGFLDKTGELAIPCQYDAVFDFSEGRAAVKKDGQWGLIAYSGDTETEQPSQSTAFSDVPANAYYAKAVDWAVAQGVTNGTSATAFRPDAAVSRAQMVTFLWRAHGAPQATGTNPFTDVSTSDYYYDAVLWAVENGVTNGTTAATFSPNASVTRSQAVTFQWRAADAPVVSGSSFADVAADAYYADAVTWAVENDITNGTGSNKFSPDVVVSRAQAVTFLYRERAE